MSSAEFRAHVAVSEPEPQKRGLLGRLHRAGSERLISEPSLTPIPLSAIVPKEAAFSKSPWSHPSLLAEAFVHVKGGEVISSVLKMSLNSEMKNHVHDNQRFSVNMLNGKLFPIFHNSFLRYY